MTTNTPPSDGWTSVYSPEAQPPDVLTKIEAEALPVTTPASASPPVAAVPGAADRPNAN